LRLTTENAVLTRRTVQLLDLTFYVAEASLLYAEKRALLQVKQRPQDRLHERLIGEFLKCEFCRQLEGDPLPNPARWVARARAVKTAAVNFFAEDVRLRR